MSSKGSDASCVPLCLEHHDQLDGRVKLSPTIGDLTPRGRFQVLHRVNLANEATDLFLEWKAFKGETNG